MKYLTWLIIILPIISVISCNGKLEKESNNGSPAVMAYYVASKDMKELERIPFDKLSHIIYSFTVVIDNEMKFSNEEHTNKLDQLVSVKREYPNLKVMIACGGWGGSGGFSDMAATPESRKKFVDSAIEFIRKHNLDGLDIDWEYPGLPGIGNPYRSEDKENFTALMHELRLGMDNLRKGLVLTFAAAGWERYFDYIELDKVMEDVDYINMMTYDLMGITDAFSGHHTNLYSVDTTQLDLISIDSLRGEGTRETLTRSADSIIRYCIQKGVPKEKIVIGGAFYGKIWKLASLANDGRYQARTKYIGTAGYSRIKSEFESDSNFIRSWDESAFAPFLINRKDSLFMTYDNPQSLAAKAKYVKDNGLGGIMFWQLNSDSEEYDLLDGIHNEMVNK